MPGMCFARETSIRDWEKLGGDYFVASWEKRGLKDPTLNEEANVASEQERECCSGRAFCMRESKSRPEQTVTKRGF